MDHQAWNNVSWQSYNEAVFRMSPSDAFSDASQVLGSDRENSRTPPRSITTDFASAMPSTHLSLPLDSTFSTPSMTHVCSSSQILDDASSWAMIGSQSSFALPGSRHSSIGHGSQTSDDRRLSNHMDLALVHGHLGTAEQHPYMAYSQRTQMAFAISPQEQSQLQAINGQLNVPAPSDYYAGNMYGNSQAEPYMPSGDSPWSQQCPRSDMAPGSDAVLFAPAWSTTSCQNFPSPLSSTLSYSQEQPRSWSTSSHPDDASLQSFVLQGSATASAGGLMTDLGHSMPTQAPFTNTYNQDIPPHMCVNEDYMSNISTQSVSPPSAVSLTIPEMPVAMAEMFDASSSPSANGSVHSSYSNPSTSPVAGPSTRREKRPNPMNSKGSGGRNGPLEPERRKNANLMREVKACWCCAFQRDKCEPGDPCPRCKNRKSRPSASNPHPQLECDRTQLPELLDYFLPNFWTSMHSTESLKSFMKDHTSRWSKVHVNIKLLPGRNLPPIDCEAYAFEPVTREPSRQFQYFRHSQTAPPQRTERPSPPLGLVQIDKPDIKRYSKYLDTVIEHSFEDLASMCYGDEDCDFQLQVLKLIKTYKPETVGEKRLLNESLRLLVVTYIMGHTLVLDEESKIRALAALKQHPTEYGKFCSPRVVNRQLKYLFHILHKGTMLDVYNRLQQVLKKSDAWPGKWTSTLCAILVLAMVHEMSQNTFHIIWDYKTITDGISRKDAQYKAAKACEAIDAKFDFVNMLFMKRSAKCLNPLRERDVEPGHWDAQLKKPAARFTERLGQLVDTHQDYLNERQWVPYEKRGNFTSRLVSRFLNRVCHINGQ